MGLPVRRIRLRRGERRRLERLVNKRTTPQRVVERANIVLCSAEGRSGSAICREVWAYRGRRSRSGSTGTRQVALKSCSRTDHARVDPARSLGTTKRRSSARPSRRSCSIEIEMSGLVEVEMSSFGACSFGVERANGTGGGDADIEPARSRPTGGTEAGGAGTSSGQARGGVAGHNGTCQRQWDTLRD